MFAHPGLKLCRCPWFWILLACIDDSFKPCLACRYNLLLPDNVSAERSVVLSSDVTYLVICTAVDSSYLVYLISSMNFT